MMRMRNRNGERVSGVRPGDLRAGKQPRDHRVDLRFLGVAVADHRLFDQPRRIFADIHSCARRRSNSSLHAVITLQ